MMEWKTRRKIPTDLKTPDTVARRGVLSEHWSDIAKWLLLTSFVPFVAFCKIVVKGLEQKATKETKKVSTDLIHRQAGW
jgi:hypothetical protein